MAKAFINVLKADGDSVSRPVHVDQDDFDLTEAFSDSLSADKGNSTCGLIMKLLTGDNVIE